VRATTMVPVGAAGVLDPEAADPDPDADADPDPDADPEPDVDADPEPDVEAPLAEPLEPDAEALPPLVEVPVPCEPAGEQAARARAVTAAVRAARPRYRRDRVVMEDLLGEETRLRYSITYCSYKR